MSPDSVQRLELVLKKKAAWPERPRCGGIGNVSVRLHGKGNVGAKPKADVIADILAAIRERRA